MFIWKDSLIKWRDLKMSVVEKDVKAKKDVNAIIDEIAAKGKKSFGRVL